MNFVEFWVESFDFLFEFFGFFDLVFAELLLLGTEFFCFLKEFSSASVEFDEFVEFYFDVFVFCIFCNEFLVFYDEF